MENQPTQQAQTNFANGFYQVYGRYPTEEDMALLRERNKRQFDSNFPKPPSGLERFASMAQPFLSYAGQRVVDYGFNKLAGAGAGSAGASAGIGSAGAGSAGAGLGGGYTGLGNFAFGAKGATGVGSTIGAGTTGAGVGTTGAGIGTTGAGIGSSIGSVALPAAAALAVAYSGYRAFDDIRKGETNNAIKTSGIFGGVGGAGIGALLAKNPYLGYLGGGAVGALLTKGLGRKDEHEKARNDINSAFQKSGLVDDDYMFNGFDAGKDGRFRLDDGRKSYEIIKGQEDEGAVWSDPEISEAVSKLNPLGFLFASGKAEEQGYGTGKLYNMLKETGDDGVTDQEILGLYDKLGVTPQEVASTLEIMANEGKVKKEDLAILNNSIEKVAGAGAIDYGLSMEVKAQQARRVREMLFS